MAVGTSPPIQVDGKLQFPPSTVEVMVVWAWIAETHTVRNDKRTINLVIFFLIFVLFICLYFAGYQ
jgi:hypothetical protein